MATLHFDLVSPDHLVFSGEVDQVDVPGTEGDFGVLAGHAPYVATLKPGILTIYRGADHIRVIVGSALAEITTADATVLAEYAVPYEEANLITIEQEIRDTEEDVADAPEGADRDKTRRRLDHLRALAAAIRTQAS
jgi:F-type H+-transporting ATPase subunit epsilon